MKSSIITTCGRQIFGPHNSVRLLHLQWHMRQMFGFSLLSTHYCDVTAIAVAAAAVYSFHHVTCAHDSHALMQSRVAAVGAEHSSLACLFTQKRRYYCCGVKYRLVKIKVLIMSTRASAHWLKFTR